MAENENGEEKTEEATAKKRKDARKKGQVLKSQDVSIVCSLFLTFLVLRLIAPMAFVRIRDFMIKYVDMAGSGVSELNMQGRETFMRGVFIDSLIVILIVSGILMAVSFVVAIVSTGVQTQFLVSTENMKFDLTKLNPANGIKKMFSLKGVFELVKSILKMTILIAVVYSDIQKRLPEIIRLMQMDVSSGVLYIAETIFSIVMTIGMVFVAVAAVDYMFQRYSYENDLKMTKQEVKDEYKQMEGDPKVKGKRRQIQQQMANQRMMQQVPEADVIIRNPTHIAVAIKYDPDKHSAPVVLAKGKEATAQRIIEAAEKADVPWVENKPLARALYEKIDIDKEITPEFYQAVSDVIIFVYRLKNKPVPGMNKPKETNTTPYNY